MSPHQTAGTLRKFLALLDKHGAVLPTEVRAELEEGIARVRTVQTWRPEGGDFIGATYEAVVTGKDPFKDKAVIAAVIAEKLVEHRSTIVAHAGRHLNATAAAHCGALIAALAGIYEEQVTTPITPAVETLAARGLGPDVDPATVLGSGTQVAAAYTTIQAATEAHHSLRNTYTLLDAQGIAHHHADPVFLYLEPGDHGLFEIRRDLGTRPSPWEVISAGMGLGLATPAEAVDRQRRAAQNDTESTQAEVVA